MQEMSETLTAREMSEWFAHFKLSHQEREEARKKAEAKAEARRGARRY